MNIIIICITIAIICICICCTILYYKYLNVVYSCNDTEIYLANKIDKITKVLYELEHELEDYEDKDVNSKLNELKTILDY